ncbi:MAG: hypothetical protein WKF84_09085 [Pyrinomonadaceae bacterium]
MIAAGAVLIRPLEGTVGWDVPYAKEGQSADEARRNVVPNFEVITPSYFRSVGIPLKSGREFTERDNEAAPEGNHDQRNDGQTNHFSWRRSRRPAHHS